MIMSAFKTRDPAFLVKVFVAYVRPVLEYASTVWSTSSVACCTILENVQRRFTRRLRGMADMDYEQRLSTLKLSSLEDRRILNDMLLVYKVFHHRTNVSAGDIGIALRHAPTRSNGNRLQHFKPASVLISNTFKCRAPIEWESIPVTAVSRQSIKHFKKDLKQHFCSQHLS